MATGPAPAEPVEEGEEAEQAQKVETWRVVNPEGFVNVRSEPSSSGAVLGRKEPGQLFRGIREGEWVHLTDEMGFMLIRTPLGEALLKRFEGDSPDEGGAAADMTWVWKFFTYDRLAREAVTLLGPEFHNIDLGMANTAEMGARILSLGERLYKEGSLPGNPTWELEESPEFMESIALWREALTATSAMAFDRLLQRAYMKAYEGYHQMGNLAPRLSSLRWNCCLCWLAMRSEAVCTVSLGSSFGTMTAACSEAACRKGKSLIFGWLRSLTKEWPVLTIFDFDLVGHGVWHDSKREALPKAAHNEWYRRGIEFDIAKLCYQAMQLPPEDLNTSAATLVMVQPYLTPDLVLSPPDVPRLILERHHWIAQYFQPSIEDLDTKALVQGLVLHIERPPEFEHDLTDPEVIGKVQRGEDLGLGDQEDGLPGAVHASLALFYAAMLTAEHVTNLHVYPGLLELQGFLEMLLKYGPPLYTLNFGGSKAALTHEHLEVVGLTGRTLTVLDLSDCNIGPLSVHHILEMLEKLPNLKHLDLANNELDGPAAVRLLEAMCINRIDTPSVRFDGNPLGDAEEFRNEVAMCLAARGAQVVAGGELVLHLGDHMMRWVPKPREGTLADRVRDESTLPPRAVSIKEVKLTANNVKKQLDKYERSDPAAKTSGGRDWLRRQREYNAKVFENPLMEMYKEELQRRVLAKDRAQEEADRAAAAAAAEREGGAGAGAGPPPAG